MKTNLVQQKKNSKIENMLNQHQHIFQSGPVATPKKKKVSINEFLSPQNRKSYYKNKNYTTTSIAKTNTMAENETLSFLSLKDEAHKLAEGTVQRNLHDKKFFFVFKTFFFFLERFLNDFDAKLFLKQLFSFSTQFKKNILKKRYHPKSVQQWIDDISSGLLEQMRGVNDSFKFFSFFSFFNFFGTKLFSKEFLACFFFSNKNKIKIFKK